MHADHGLLGLLVVGVGVGVVLLLVLTRPRAAREHGVRHEDEVAAVEEEGGGEDASGVHAGQVLGVEEARALALLPAPHEDVVERAGGA